MVEGVQLGARWVGLQGGDLHRCHHNPIASSSLDPGNGERVGFTTGLRGGVRVGRQYLLDTLLSDQNAPL